MPRPNARSGANASAGMAGVDAARDAAKAAHRAVARAAAVAVVEAASAAVVPRGTTRRGHRSHLQIWNLRGLAAARMRPRRRLAQTSRSVGGARVADDGSGAKAGLRQRRR